MRRSVNIEDMTSFARWFSSAIDHKGTNLKRVAEAINTDYTYLWKVMNAHKPLYKQYRRPGYEITRELGKHLGDVDGALKAADFYEEHENRAGMTTERPDIEYAPDPDLQIVIEAFEGADAEGRLTLKQIALQQHRLNSALSASRTGAHGERKDD